uniref:Malate dehydrogenase, mitochondrial n=1 Tax=Timema shepardi TaxID=629360 RepID=A0A7R9AUF6_TIMSH|nr:unnamed protein product [Timema shepardi]
MLRRVIQCALRRNLPRIQYGHRFYSEFEAGDILTNRFRVTVLGATGQLANALVVLSSPAEDGEIEVRISVGQPLSLMLKQSPLIHELALYDVEGTLGVAADISQVDTGCKVCSFTGPEELDAALKRLLYTNKFSVKGGKEGRHIEQRKGREQRSGTYAEMPELASRSCPGQESGCLQRERTSHLTGRGIGRTWRKLGSKIVLITASGTRTECGVSEEENFLENAKIVQELSVAIHKSCPMALIGVITNPINSMVPIVVETFKKQGDCTPGKVFGVTAIDVVRANTFVAETLGLDPECVFVPVVGGHSGATTIPILSQAKPCNELTQEQIERLTAAIQDADGDIIRAKRGRGIPTLSVAFAATRFAISLARGINGQPSVVECAYVASEVVQAVNYFSSPILIGPDGVMEYLGLPKMSEYENCLLSSAIPILQDDVKRGLYFVHGEPPPIMTSTSTGLHDLTAALTMSTSASYETLITLQFFCHQRNKCLFVARCREKIIFSSQKLCCCIEADGRVCDLPALLTEEPAS